MYKYFVILHFKMEGREINTKSVNEIGWIKLDNAAKLFPAIMSDELTSVFRITSTLYKPVNYPAIKEAVEITSRRYPYFNVSLGSGLFWHYLEYNGLVPRIQTEEQIPCTAFASKRKNEPLYRILVKRNRISVEFIHILTDGSGALEYLKTLLLTYFTLQGYIITPGREIINPDSQVLNEEMEDGYNRFFIKNLPPPKKLTKAWHLPYSLNKKPRRRIITSEIPVEILLETTRKLKVTITEYIVSVYLFSLQNIFIEERGKGKLYKRKVLRIEVPVNMRKKFSSITMRNFSLFVMPEIDLRLGKYTFDEVLKIVHHFLQAGTETKQITRFLSQNVSHEKRIIIRLLPLFIKRLVISTVYRRLGSARCSGILTNLGAIKLPPEMENLIESFDLLPTPPNERVKVTCAMVSFKGKLRISFSNITHSHGLERHFLTNLTGAGIPVRIISNY
jgi:NRPS condensation-like uncharacterized protein